MASTPTKMTRSMYCSHYSVAFFASPAIYAFLEVSHKSVCFSCLLFTIQVCFDWTFSVLTYVQSVGGICWLLAEVTKFVEWALLLVYTIRVLVIKNLLIVLVYFVSPVIWEEETSASSSVCRGLWGWSFSDLDRSLLSGTSLHRWQSI